jgi:hypothetical protein
LAAVRALAAQAIEETAGVELDAQHAYRRGGIVRPGVTSVLTSQGFIEGDFYTEESRQRGTFIHEATVFVDRNTLDEESVPEKWAAYLESYRLWLTRRRPHALLREARLHHPVFDYCGTVDFFGFLADDAWPWTIDFKTGPPQRWHRVQTAAYEAAIFVDADARAMLRRRGSLYLHGDGREATLVQHAGSRDFGFFQAALTCYRFKEAVE